MNLKNQKVHHRQFGDGVVTEQTPSVITVQFSEEYGPKKFLYPAAFESFLTLDSPALREKMEAELHAIREQLEAGRRQIGFFEHEILEKICYDYYVVEATTRGIQPIFRQQP